MARVPAKRKDIGTGTPEFSVRSKHFRLGRHRVMEIWIYPHMPNQ
jgi:hypothetical protein